MVALPNLETRIEFQDFPREILLQICEYVLVDDYYAFRYLLLASKVIQFKLRNDYCIFTNNPFLAGSSHQLRKSGILLVSNLLAPDSTDSDGLLYNISAFDGLNVDDYKKVLNFSFLKRFKGTILIDIWQLELYKRRNKEGEIPRNDIMNYCPSTKRKLDNLINVINDCSNIKVKITFLVDTPIVKLRLPRPGALSRPDTSLIPFSKMFNIIQNYEPESNQLLRFFQNAMPAGWLVHDDGKGREIPDVQDYIFFTEHGAARYKKHFKEVSAQIFPTDFRKYTKTGFISVFMESATRVNDKMKYALKIRTTHPRPEYDPRILLH